MIEIQHPTPYYDDSYAVNSAAQGPYGDAIVRELIPHIEKKYRGIGQGYARFTYGGSTGGWEAMASQVFYPRSSMGHGPPVPIRSTSAPTPSSTCTPTQCVRARQPLEAHATQRAAGLPGPADGHHAGDRAARDGGGQQGPVGRPMGHLAGHLLTTRADGYPKPIWDRQTGRIDRSVADYWREHFDLTHIVMRDWNTLGPVLRGKLHIYVGDMDNYYLQLTPSISHSATSRRCRTRWPRWSSRTATARSIAGMAIPRGRTASRGCGTTRCSFHGSCRRSEASSRGCGHVELAVLRRAAGRGRVAAQDL